MASFENANYICTCYAKKCDRNCRTYRRFTHTESNADRIRAMTDEELAVWIAETSNCSDWCILNEKCKSKLDNEACPNVWLEWLREESEGE